MSDDKLLQWINLLPIEKQKVLFFDLLNVAFENLSFETFEGLCKLILKRLGKEEGDG